MSLPRSSTFVLFEIEMLTFVAIRRSPRKIEKKPVYVLNLAVPPANVDKYLEPAKSHVQFQVNISFGQELRTL